MKIELKKFKLVHGHDDDLPFTADLYVNGVLTAHCENDGWGGGTQFHVVNQRMYNEVTAYAKLQKDARFPDLELNLDCLLDKEINRIMAEKDAKKNIARVKRDFKNKIVVGTDGVMTGTDLNYSFYKYNQPLERILSTMQGRAAVYNFINNTVKPNLKPGQRILNDNLQGLI